MPDARKTLKFVKETRIAATPEAVFAFHESPEALTRLIPPWENMRVAESSGSLAVGSRVVLRGKVFGLLPVKWVARHVEYDPPHRFADVQESGPFAEWHHSHQFVSDGHGGTILRDEIHYRPPFGALGRWFGNALIRKKLERMFTYRHQTTREMVEGKKKKER